MSGPGNGPTAPLQKLTEGELELLVVDEEYMVNGTTTIAVLTINGGFKLIGTSACINPDDYRKTLGEQLARAKAFDRLWELEAYHRMRNAAPPFKTA